MIKAFSKAVDQLFDPAFRKVLLLSLLLTTAVFVGLGFLVSQVLSYLTLTKWEWLNTILDFLLFGGFSVLTFLLFPAVATLFIGIFLDDIAAAVERRYYPGDPPGQPQPFAKSFWNSFKFMAFVVAINIVVLPFYILVIWFPIINLVIFYCLNGYLLGREYFDLVSHRHLPVRQARELRRRHRRRLFLTRVVIVVTLTIPFLNLLAPIVATAAMVHVFKDLVGAGRQPA